jgi:hypothetical protein
MFLVNGIKCTLRQFNRTESDSAYDDQNYKDTPIKVCPYNVDQAVRYGIYTIPEATGYYQLPRWVNVREGDQIIFNNHGEQVVHTILKVQDEWIFNRVENYICAVK